MAAAPLLGLGGRSRSSSGIQVVLAGTLLSIGVPYPVSEPCQAARAASLSATLCRFDS
jgi:hypothetical protein